MLLAEVYERCGVVARVDPATTCRTGTCTATPSATSTGCCAMRTSWSRLPGPGDVAVFRFGRTFSHGAIVTDWPRLIHAYWAASASCGATRRCYPLAGREVRFFGSDR